jgi:hypothetical protein
MRHRVDPSPIVVLACVGTLLGPAFAQPGGILAPEASDGAGRTVASPAETQRVFSAVDDWLRAGGQEPLDLRDPEGVAGANITLRLDEAVVAFAARISPGADDVVATATAARDQLREAFYTPADGWRRGVLEAVRLDLELAGQRTPLPGASWAQAARLTSPGVDALAMDLGGRVAAVFPSRQIRLGFGPARALRVAAGELDLAPIALAELARRTGATPFRYEVIRLARLDVAEPPRFIHRGGLVTPARAITGDRVARLANNAAEWLIAQQWPGDEPLGLQGDLNAGAGARVSAVAPLRSQLVAAYALARFARLPEADAGARAGAREAASIILEHALATTDEESPAWASGVPGAAWLLARAELRRSGPTSRAIEEAVEATRDALRAWMARDAEQVNIGASAFLAFALLSDLREDVDIDEDARTRTLVLAVSLVDGILRASEPGELPEAMPWLGWAITEFPMDAQADAPTPRPDEARYAALRDMLALLERAQLETDDLSYRDRDASGGYVFTVGGHTLPTWHTLRPGAFVATALGQPRLVNSDRRPATFEHLRRLLRFLDQLAVEWPRAALYDAGFDAVGGVRTALWSPRVSIDATSMGLLTACEALRAARTAFAEPVEASRVE